jgi:serine/threonine protein phosphatase PrpC
MIRTLPRFDFRVDFAALSDVGRVRANNEDVWRAEPNLATFVIADGMGGHAAGEVAARLAVDGFVEAVKSKDTQRAFDRFVAAPTLESRHRVFAHLRRAADAANSAVRAEAESSEEKRGMGCTLDAAVLLRDRAFVVHAGDSRVYLARASATLQLTHDHNLFESLRATGQVPRTAPYPAQNPLINAVGLMPKLTVDCMFVDLSRGDRLVLCTDGAYGPIPNEGDFASLVRAGTPEEAARSLIDTSLVRGGRDNATAVVIDVAERFVTRELSDGGVMARDIATARVCPLFAELPSSAVLRALAAATEIEIAGGELIPRTVASDQVAYIVLDGEVAAPDGRTFGGSALLYGESLAGGWRDTTLYKTTRVIRALRLRADDFQEVCQSDVVLAASLYERLARYLARLIH